jgi:hypothetical protein
MSRSAVWLVRLYLIAVGLTLLVGGALSLVLRYELWDPGRTLAGETYGSLLTAHGLALGFVAWPGAILALANLVVVDVRRPPSAPTLPLAYLGLAAWIAGAATMGTGARAITGLYAAAFGLTSIHLVVTAARGPGALRGARLLAALGAVAAVAGEAFVFAAGWLERNGRAPQQPPALAAALVVCASPWIIERASGRRRSVWPAATAVVLLLVPGFVDGGVPVLVGVAGLWLACGFLWLAALANRARGTAPLLHVSLGVVPALLAGGTLGAFLDVLAPDIHVHDTVVPVAATHLIAGATVVALVAARAGAGRLARVAAILLGPGIVGAEIALAYVGFRGMPRRYQAYLDLFALPQKLVGVAACVGFAGGVVAVVAMLRRGGPVEAVPEDLTDVFR